MMKTELCNQQKLGRTSKINGGVACGQVRLSSWASIGICTRVKGWGVQFTWVRRLAGFTCRLWWSRIGITRTCGIQWTTGHPMNPWKSSGIGTRLMIDTLLDGFYFQWQFIQSLPEKITHQMKGWIYLAVCSGKRNTAEHNYLPWKPVVELGVFP